MKRFNIGFKFFIGVVLLLQVVATAFAQGRASGYLYVFPSDLTAYPNQQGIPANPSLQALFQQFQVVSYVQAFPGAVTNNLGKAYAIHLDGDENALKSQLEASGLFSLIEREAYMQIASTMLNCPEPCSNPQSVNDPHSSYEITLPGYLCAWNITQGDPSVVVAVVDTDFDIDHPDLQGQIISKVGIPGSPDCASHGTTVAGTIVAKANNDLNTAGVAPGVRVTGYVVTTPGPCPDKCSGDVWGPTWQAYLDGHRIINVSWSGLGISSQVASQMIREMTENGTLLVLAAGNHYGQVSHGGYSNIPGVINVSSVSDDGTIHSTNADPNQPAVSYNQYVDLCAPGDGVGIIEVDVCGTTYHNAWGTSQSAPNVSGAAALMLSVNPCLMPSEIENILKVTACPIVNNPIPGETGAGYLNAYAAVEKAKGVSGFILADQTWDGENYASDNIIVANGATLTINGVLKIAEGKKIEVQPGAHVVLNGRLTNSCMYPWEGIFVNGSPGESQYTPGQHGKLTCRPGSVIENAKIAVTLTAGGILNATGAFFINNGTSVYYLPYSNFWPLGPQYGQPRDHLGGLFDCSFVVNDDYARASKFKSFVELEGVRGINILGCSFSNDRTIKNPMSNEDYGYGVKATDALFKVMSQPVGSTSPPTSYDHTGFKGLGYGVYTGTAQSGTNATALTYDDFVSVPYLVQQATFTECIYGIHNRFVSQGIIVGNIFNMGKLPAVGQLSGNLPFTNIQVGVFIENGANGFELQENQFIKVEDNVKYAYGTYCQNLGWFNNDVRRNIYTNVDAGNLADEVNSVSGIQLRGLYYLCNTNSTQQYDFLVFPDGKIRFHQGVEMNNGTTFMEAGNVFSKANPPTGDFEVNGSSLRYYYDDISAKPLYYTGLMLSGAAHNNCESNFCLPPCLERGEMGNMSAEYDAGRAQYLAAMAEMETAQAAGNEALVAQKLNIAAAHRLRMDEISNALSLHMAFETSDYDLDQARAWWQKMESPVSEMILARDYLFKDQKSLAFEVLDGISAQYNLSDAELADLRDYRDIMQLMQGEEVANLTEDKVKQLLDYANYGSGISAAWAKNILTVLGYHFPPQPKLLPSQERNQVLKPSNAQPASYSVSPNPAKDYVIFTRDDAQSMEGVSVLVTDAAGQMVWCSPSNNNSNKAIWQMTDVQSGIYFYTIRNVDGTVQAGRIVVVK